MDEREAALGAEGLEVVFYPLDVADPDSIDACRALLLHDGIAIDVLVNNAGIYSVGDAASVDASVLDATWAVMPAGLGWSAGHSFRTCSVAATGAWSTSRRATGRSARDLHRSRRLFGDEGGVECTHAVLGQGRRRRHQGERDVPRVGAHANGRPRRDGFAGAGGRHRRLAGGASTGRTNWRVLPPPPADSMVNGLLGEESQ